MKEKMKSKFIKTVAVLLAVSMVICLFPVMDLQAKDEDFDAQVQIGFGNEAEIGKYVPFYITVENKSKDFNGAVQVIIPVGGKENYMYEQNVSIPANAQKTVSFVLPVYSTFGRINIRLANEKEKVIWSKEKRFTVLTDIENVNVGIMSNDYSALSYMDRQQFQGNNQFVTKIFEIDEHSFGADWHALDMLDVIVISDFSTDLLTESQIRALTMWISNGGLLLVGTGSTSSKTLSGLNNKLFEVTPGKLQTKETKLGLTLRDFNYGYANNYSYNVANYDPYSDDEFMESFSEDFEAYFDEYEELYRSTFEQEWWGGEIDDETWQEDWVREAFKDFCMKDVYEIYVSSNGAGATSSSDVENGPSISTSVLQMDADKEDDVVVGEDIYGGVYDLYHIFNVGDGYIVVAGIDFTKNPIPGYQFASLFFVDIVESLIGTRVNEEYNNSKYSYSYNSSNGFNYDEKSYLKNVSDAPIPPALLYLGLLLIFQGLLVALYFILGHKKKSFKLWFWYPAIAIGTTLLIFCLGFTTRLMRPRLKADSLIVVEDNLLSEKTYAAFSVPRNKNYKLSVSSRYQARQGVPSSYSYSYNQSEIDMDSYTKSYNISANSSEIQIKEIEPLGTEGIILETIDYTDKDIVIDAEIDEWTGTIYAEDIAITNKMGIDLENVLVIVRDGDYKGYALGKIKQGETKKLSQKEKETDTLFYMEKAKMTEIATENLHAVLGLFTGSLNPKFKEYRNRTRILNRAISEYSENGGSGTVSICVYAFPKSSLGEKIQENKKYHEDRTEILIKRWGRDKGTCSISY